MTRVRGNKKEVRNNLRFQNIFGFFPSAPEKEVRNKEDALLVLNEEKRKEQEDNVQATGRSEKRFFSYEGQYAEGQKHGHGTLFFGDGGSLTANFVCGEVYGEGTRVWSLVGRFDIEPYSDFSAK